jgi:hypothetical protein
MSHGFQRCPVYFGLGAPGVTRIVPMDANCSLAVIDVMTSHAALAREYGEFAGYKPYLSCKA